MANQSENETQLKFDRERLREVFARVKGLERPVLSLYANVDPSQPESLTRAVNIRVHNTLRDLEGLPPTVAEKVSAYFNGRLPEGRSVAVFASVDDIEVVHLDMPVVQDDADHLQARVGDPYFTPLLTAMNAWRPYLVAFLERDDLVLYRVFLGQAEQLWQASRKEAPGEDDTLDQSKNRFPHSLGKVQTPDAASHSTAGHQQNKPKYVADRGDAARQLADEHVVALQERFYRDAVDQVRSLMDEHSIERMILLGPDRNRHTFLAELPGDLAKCVCALLPSTEGKVPAPRRVVELVQESIERIEQEQDGQLVDAIVERGVRGLESCLRALQEGRLYRLAVPQTLERQVFVDPVTNYVSLDEKEAAGLSGKSPKRTELSQKLPELAESFGVHLEFVNGDQERRVVDELGGMGGLGRW